jgi:AGCS family alanine or glycine:cation symporter
MDAAWAAADITMGLMTVINLPCCFVLYRIAGDALKDYESQSKAGINPEFRAGKIGLDERKYDFWKD